MTADTAHVNDQTVSLPAEGFPVSRHSSDHSANKTAEGFVFVHGKRILQSFCHLIQGRAALWLDRLEGDYYTIMGLPVSRTARLLSRF